MKMSKRTVKAMSMKLIGTKITMGSSYLGCVCVSFKLGGAFFFRVAVNLEFAVLIRELRLGSKF